MSVSRLKIFDSAGTARRSTFTEGHLRGKRCGTSSAIVCGLVSIPTLILIVALGTAQQDLHGFQVQIDRVFSCTPNEENDPLLHNETSAWECSTSTTHVILPPCRGRNGDASPSTIVLLSQPSYLALGHDVDKVVAQAFGITSQSWEFGTLAKALLELRNEELAVFAVEPFPEGQIPRVSEPEGVEGLRYSMAVIRTNHTWSLVDGGGKEVYREHGGASRGQVKEVREHGDFVLVALLPQSRQDISPTRLVTGPGQEAEEA